MLLDLTNLRIAVHEILCRTELDRLTSRVAHELNHTHRGLSTDRAQKPRQVHRSLVQHFILLIHECNSGIGVLDLCDIFWPDPRHCRCILITPCCTRSQRPQGKLDLRAELLYSVRGRGALRAIHMHVGLGPPSNMASIYYLVKDGFARCQPQPLMNVIPSISVLAAPRNSNLLLLSLIQIWITCLSFYSVDLVRVHSIARGVSVRVSFPFRCSFGTAHVGPGRVCHTDTVDFPSGMLHHSCAIGVRPAGDRRQHGPGCMWDVRANVCVGNHCHNAWARLAG